MLHQRHIDLALRVILGWAPFDTLKLWQRLAWMLRVDEALAESPPQPYKCGTPVYCSLTLSLMQSALEETGSQGASTAPLGPSSAADVSPTEPYRHREQGVGRAHGVGLSPSRGRHSGGAIYPTT